jgi:hypothetical protein
LKWKYLARLEIRGVPKPTALVFLSGLCDGHAGVGVLKSAVP